MVSPLPPLAHSLVSTLAVQQDYRIRKAARQQARSRQSDAAGAAGEHAYTASLSLQRNDSSRSSVPRRSASSGSMGSLDAGAEGPPSNATRSRSSTLSRVVRHARIDEQDHADTQPLPLLLLSRSLNAESRASSISSNTGIGSRRRSAHASAPPCILSPDIHAATEYDDNGRNGSLPISPGARVKLDSGMSRRPSSSSGTSRRTSGHHQQQQLAQATGRSQSIADGGPELAMDERVRHVSAHTFGRPSSPTGSVVAHDDDLDEEQELAAQMEQQAQHRLHERQEQAMRRLTLDDAEEAEAEPTVLTLPPQRSISRASSVLKESGTTAPSCSSSSSEAGGTVDSIIAAADAALSASNTSCTATAAASASPSARPAAASAVQRDDNSAYGIPARVHVDGNWVDITDLDILEQVEMIRKAQMQSRRAKLEQQQEAAKLGLGSQMGPMRARDTLELSTFTELSVIA